MKISNLKNDKSKYLNLLKQFSSSIVKSGNSVAKWRPEKNSAVYILPSGLSAIVASRKFQAIVDTVQDARHQAIKIPKDLSLKDFEFVADSENHWNSHLLTFSQPMEALEVNQEQPVLARVIFQLVTGRSLPNLINTSEAIITAFEEVTPLAHANKTPLHSYTELATVIQKGLKSEYNSLNELNGAFGWALYKDGQLQPFKERSSYAKTEGNHNPSNSEFWQSPIIAASKATPPRMRLTLRRNVWVLTGIVFINLLAVIALLGVLNNTELVNERVPVANIANPATATQGGGTSNTAKKNNTDPSSSITSSTSVLNAGATKRNLELNRLRSNFFIPPAALQPGDAELWSAPNIRVIGQYWYPPSDSTKPVVDVITSDGNFSTYSGLENSNPLTVVSALKDDEVGACWSSDGKRYAALLNNGQILLTEPASKIRQQFAISNSKNSYSAYDQNYNLCQHFISWSPDSQKLVIMDDDLQLWAFGQDGVRHVQAKNPISYDPNTDNVIWSPDSSKFAILSAIRGAVSTSMSIYNAITFELVNYIEIKDNSAPDLNGYTYSYNDVWSPDSRRIARLIIKSDQGKGIITTSVQIFTMPNQVGNLNEPASASVIENNSLSSEHFDHSDVLPKTMVWLPGSNEIAVYQIPQIKSQSSSDNSGEISIFIVGSNDKLTPLTKFSTGNYNVTYMSWDSQEQHLLTADAQENLRLWTLTELKLETVPTQITPNFISLNGQSRQQSVSSSLPLISPDSKHIATVSNNFINFYNSETGKIQTTFKLDNDKYSVMMGSGKWSDNSQYFASQFMFRQDSKTVSVLHVWQFINDQINEVGSIFTGNFSYSNISLGPEAFEKWYFVPNTATIRLINSSNQVLEYNLSVPLPPLEQQADPENVINTAMSNSPTPSTKTPTSTTKPAYTLVGKFSQDISNLYDIVAISHKKDTVALKSQNYYTLFKFQATGQTKDQSAVKIMLAAADQKEQPEVIKVIFSPDDSLIAFGLHNGSVKIFNTENGKLLSIIAATQSILTDIDFFPTGNTLATASSDRTIKIWQISETSNWSLTQILGGFTNPIQNAYYSPDGKFLIVSDTAGAIILWKIN